MSKKYFKNIVYDNRGRVRVGPLEIQIVFCIAIICLFAGPIITIIGFFAGLFAGLIESIKANVFVSAMTICSLLSILLIVMIRKAKKKARILEAHAKENARILEIKRNFEEKEKEK